jgi:hypothetical protein
MTYRTYIDPYRMTYTAGNPTLAQCIPPTQFHTNRSTKLRRKQNEKEAG